MNFSRRKLTVPLPPRPASTRISASSTNFTASEPSRRAAEGAARSFLDERRRAAPGVGRADEKAPTRGASRRRAHGGASGRHDAHVLALPRSLRLERDPAVHEREQRVIAADADIRSRMKARAPLAHDDVAGRDALAAEALHAEPFGFGIAAVLRAAACLFVCHRRISSMSS